MDRRRFLKICPVSMALLAGCPGQSEDSTSPEEGTPTESNRGPDGAGQSETDSGDVPDLELNETPPSVPEDPFIVTAHGTPFFQGKNGWQPTTYERKQRTILGLHAEALDFRRITGFNGPPLNNTQGIVDSVKPEGWFALDHGLAASKAQDPDLNQDVEGGRLQRFWYRHLTESKKVRYPDGRIVQDASEFAAKNLEREPVNSQRGGHDVLVPSLFSSGYLRWKVAVARQLVASGFARVTFDSVNGPVNQGLDFSTWARSAFRSHLASLSERRLERLDIENPTEFDIREYFKNNSLPGGVHDLFVHHLDDPVAREYGLFHHEGMKTFVDEYVTRTKRTLPAHIASEDVSLYGNQFKIWRPPSIYLSDHFDAIVPEYDPSIPPSQITEYVSKLALAAARYEKPALLQSNSVRREYGNVPEELDTSSENATLCRLQIAEIYANGAVPELQLTGFAPGHIDEIANNIVKADGTVKDPVQSLIDFVWTHKRFLHEGKPDNSVAVVYSLPTLIWQWGERYRPHRHSFEHAAEFLREHQFPYDAALFGHPRLWNDSDQLDRLRSYDVVVLPGLESITDAQVGAIETVLDEGTSVVVTSHPPTRTAMYDERDDFRTLINEDPDATVLDAKPSSEAFVDAIEADGPGQVDIDGGEDLAANVITNETRPFTALHLVNYAYTPETDTIETKSDVAVSIRGLDFDVGEAVWYSPDLERELTFDVQDGAVSVTVPKVNEWGFVVFAPAGDALQPTVDEEIAEEQLSQAQTAVDAAADEDRTHRLTRAKVNLQRAETAARDGAYQQVVTAAEAATEQAEEAYQPPVVGLDQAHNNSEDHDWSYYDEFRAEFDDYTHQRVEDWSEETLSTLDVLLVPPTMPAGGATYGFTDTELARITDFVDSGGSLFVTARSEVASDLDTLLEPFGLGVDGEPLTSGKVHIVSRPTKLTRMTLKWKTAGRAATAVQADDDNVLARAYATDEVLVNRSGDFYSGSQDGPTGPPIYATTRYGAGLVAVIGYDRAFFNLGESGGRPDDYEVVRSALRFLGRRARYARTG